MLKSAGEIISNSFHLYIKNWRALVPYLGLLFLPTVALSLLGIISLYLEVIVPKSSLPTNLLITVVGVATIVLNIWTTIAMAKALSGLLSGQTTNWRENFSLSSPLIWPFIYTSLLSGLIIIGGFLLLLIPGIIFTVWYSFYVYVMIFENQKGMAALKTSKSLVLGRWWSIAWKIVAPNVIFGAINLALFYVLASLVDLLPLTEFLKGGVASVVTSLGTVLVAPLSTAAMLILYYSAKQNPVSALPSTPPSQQM
ncbi:MAG: hypothetical protein HYT15_00650 [Candidatus Magasanikbacteria bacterium]|nr:hypothetical protein [Candidatus Magasanikbacteria bacterium]